MITGYRGTFIIPWAQTEIDGLTGAPVRSVGVGSTWRWTGNPIRVDSPTDVFVLENALNMDDLHQRAARNAQKLIGPAHLNPTTEISESDDDRLFEAGLELTDGRDLYRVTLIEIPGSPHPMLLFVGNMPPKDEDLWVVTCMTQPLLVERAEMAGRGVICFVPGTKISTVNGPVRVEELAEGDQLLTKDNGAQEIRWVGQRSVSGARLHAMPHMRPIRLRANILGQGEPDEDLIVSPDHRILVKGAIANALFNTPEVLVSARDMVNDGTITVDHSLRDVNYIHLMLDHHQVVWANGVETESFHPASAHVDQIDPVQRNLLSARFPDVEHDPFAYGDFARRTLSASEAAILAYDGLRRH